MLKPIAFLLAPAGITSDIYLLMLGILVVLLVAFLCVRFLVRRRIMVKIREIEILQGKHRALFDRSPDPIALFSERNGKIIDGNTSLLEMLACTRRDLQMKTIQSILVPDIPQGPGTVLETLLSEGRIGADGMFLKTDEDARIPVVVTSMRVSSGSGTGDLVQVIMRDMSLVYSLRERLAARDKMLDAFGVINKLLNSGEGVDTPVRFKELVRVIGTVVRSDITTLLFLDRAVEVATGYRFDIENGDQVRSVTLDLDENSVYKWIAFNRKPLMQEDLDENGGFTEDAEMFRQGVRSYLILPLIMRGRVMGALNIFNRKPGMIRKDDVEVLRYFADHLTLGVSNIQLQQEAEKKAQRLKQILVTSNSFRLQVFLGDLLREIVWSIRFSTGFNFVVLGMLNHETQRVEIKALADNEKGAMKRLIGSTYSWESFKGLMKEEQKISHSYLVRRKEPILAKIKELVVSNDDSGRMEEGVRKGYTLFVPIETKLRKVVGFLLVDDSKEMDGRSIETVQTMEIFANEVAVVIDNQRLFEEAKKKSEELQQLNQELQISKTSLEKAKKMLEASNEELERANNELREVDKLKAEFLQNVTHELRTPLAPIMVNSEVLLLKKIGDLTPVQEEIVQSIFQSTKRLNSLIDDLLDLTKMESGKMKYQFTRVNPESLVNNSLVETYPFIQEKGIEINKQIECGSRLIYGDSSRLIQLLTNLLRNAVKFTPEGGRIDLSIRGNGSDKIELMVSDTGIGIPSSKLDRIFDRFYQVDGSATRKYKGAGLGLAIVKKIVEAHKGEIKVESREGAGTKFTVILPAVTGGIGEESLVRTLG